METRIALIGIIVSDRRQIGRLNELLSEHQQYILGRMGLPHQNGGISLISIAIEAPEDVISTISGRIGMMEGISTKVIYAKK